MARRSPTIGRSSRGSVLILALWIIAILSVMVLSFASEAHLEAGVNVFVRERNRVNRLVDSGRALAEVVLLGYRDAPDRTEDQDDEALLEDDRFVLIKQALKETGSCTVGPILLDESDPESGTVTVKISPSNSMNTNVSGGGVINVNQLSKTGGDSKYQERWWILLASHGVPEEYELDDKKVSLWNTLVASWDDWRDEDDTVTAFDGEECGAETTWYKERYEDEERDTPKEDRRYPRQGTITQVDELSCVRGFRDYPVILYGGVLNPEERDKNSQIRVRGVASLFTTEGTQKIDVNSADEDTLITVPGVYQDLTDPDEIDEVIEEARERARAIEQMKSVEPNDDNHSPEPPWLFKDFTDLNYRLEQLGEDPLPNEAEPYFSFGTDENMLFRVVISCESMGLEMNVEALAYVKDKEVRYTEWSESPVENSGGTGK